MDEIQKVLIKAGRKDLAQKYYKKVEAAKKVAVAPPKWEGTVQHMKKHKEITNPWALAWAMHGEGAEPHYTEKGKLKAKYKK